MLGPALPSQSNGNELWLTVPRSLTMGLAVAYARCHCSRYPGRFLSIERLFPSSTSGIREASPVELGEPAVATKVSKTDQSENDKTASERQ